MSESFDCGNQTGSCAGQVDARESRQGVAGGIFVRYPLLRRLFVQGELLYAQEGYEGTEPTMHVDYLELPVLLRFDPLQRKRSGRIFLQAGIAPAVRVRCTQFGTETSGYYKSSCGQNPGYMGPPQAPGPIDVDGIIGIGGGWDFSFGDIEIELRYSRSLINTGAWQPGGKTTNSAYYLLLEYGRPISGGH